MTIVQGQIEPLKRIRAILNQKGITRFNSVGEINFFVKNYESERQKIIDQAENDLNIEIEVLEADMIKLQDNYDNLRTNETYKLCQEIDDLRNKYDLIESKNTNALGRAFNLLRLRILKSRKKRLEKNFDEIILKSTSNSFQKVQELRKTLEEYTSNRARVISYRSLFKTREIAYTKEVVDGLYPLIAGAIGENLVVNELNKLSDKHILFNDFSVDFETPIYNRNEDDRIFSIQIDHLLVTNSGIFIIETKNWSKESIKNFDLRSPIEQIKRTSYALFVIMNSGSNQSRIQLKRHHWGDKQLPIRNLVVMIDNKPKEKFKHVQVKTLKELNGYITYFDPIFDDSEVNRICEYLAMLKS